MAEALTNAVRHARASAVSVEVETVGEFLRVMVRDDGAGGAGFTGGTGLVGLKDRVEALGGRILLNSPRGAGTSLRVELPLAAGASGLQRQALEPAADPALCGGIALNAGAVSYDERGAASKTMIPQVAQDFCD